MKTIDFHSHLLSRDLAFDRIYDKLAISMFAKKLGTTPEELLKNKYKGFESAFIRNIKESNHVKKSVILPVDSIVDVNGKEISKDKTVCSSNEDILDLYNRHPNEVIPFFSINPNRKDALDLIDKYFENGFKGAKFLQNYWNIDINDKKYIPYFEKIKKYDLPIIIHTGGEHAVSSNPLFEKISVSNLAIDTGCKVVLAHFGVNMIMEQKLNKLHYNFSFQTEKFGEDYHLMIDYLSKNKNVYADLSAVIAFFRTKIVEDLAKNQTHIHDKLLFGTDYPVPFSIIFSYHRLSLKKRLELEQIKNPLDRYALFFLEFFNENNPIFNNWEKLLGDKI